MIKWVQGLLTAKNALHIDNMCSTKSMWKMALLFQDWVKKIRISWPEYYDIISDQRHKKVGKVQ